MPAAKYIGFPAGTQTASIYAGGATTPPANGNQVNTTYKYDGTNWTAGNNMNETRFDGAGFGTQTAAIAATGAKNPGSGRTSAVESYDGTNWTEIAEVNSQRYGAFGAGVQTSGLIASGYDGSYRAYTETWNGTAWTEVGDLNSAGADRFGGGTSTANIATGGINSAGTAVVAIAELWDGSAWTETSDLNTARSQGAGSGIYTNALVFGGTVPNGAKTELFDGSSWTELADLSTARIMGGGSPAGTSETALYMGGATPTGVANTEEWSAPAVFNKQVEGQLFYNSTANAFKETILDIPNAAWSSGGNLNTGRGGSFGYGTEGTTMGVVAGIGAGSHPDGNGNSSAHEQYNGTSWTEVNEMNNPRSDGSASGPFTSSIMIAGFDDYAYYSSPYAVDCETWDGTSFTEVANLNTGRGYVGSSGTSSTSALVSSGYTSPPATGYANTEIFDGSAWTEVADLNTSRPGAAGSAGAPVTDTVFFGGVKDHQHLELQLQKNGMERLGQKLET